MEIQEFEKLENELKNINLETFNDDFKELEKQLKDFDL